MKYASTKNQQVISSVERNDHARFKPEETNKVYKANRIVSEKNNITEKLISYQILSLLI